MSLRHVLFTKGIQTQGRNSHRWSNSNGSVKSVSPTISCQYGQQNFSAVLLDSTKILSRHKGTLFWVVFWVELPWELLRIWQPCFSKRNQFAMEPCQSWVRVCDKECASPQENLFVSRKVYILLNFIGCRIFYKFASAEWSTHFLQINLSAPDLLPFHIKKPNRLHINIGYLISH